MGISSTFGYMRSVILRSVILRNYRMERILQLSATELEKAEQLKNKRQTEAQAKKIITAISDGNIDSAVEFINSLTTEQKKDSSKIFYYHDIHAFRAPINILTMAAYANSHEIFAAMLNGMTPLEKQELLSQQSRFGITPLMVAAQGGKIELIQYLSSLISEADFTTLLNQRDNQGLTVLMHSITSNNSQLVEFLMNKGALPAPEETGISLLHHAVENNAYNVMPLLLKSTDININHTNSARQTPLAAAISLMRSDIAIMLTEAGADFNLVSLPTHKQKALYNLCKDKYTQRKLELQEQSIEKLTKKLENLTKIVTYSKETSPSDTPPQMPRSKSTPPLSFIRTKPNQLPTLFFSLDAGSGPDSGFNPISRSPSPSSKL